MQPKILVITPVHHISGVTKTLEETGDVTYLEDPSSNDVVKMISEYDAIFTNPNKSKVFLGKEILDAAKNLKVICTASTGTNHIDKKYAALKNIIILSLTEERDVINRISSTAELAFALTLASIRNLVKSHNNALTGEWDYTKYIGRQMNGLTIGVIGYGRLGSMYAHYCLAFDSRVLIYDPYKSIEKEGLKQVEQLDVLLQESDIISIHVHVNGETIGMLDSECFAKMKDDVLIVNTARGDIIVEQDLVSFLKDNPKAKIATDVLADEIRNRTESPILNYAKKHDQVIITQHIGGMTREAQEIAYGHAAKRLQLYYTKPNLIPGIDNLK